MVAAFDGDSGERASAEIRDAALTGSATAGVLVAGADLSLIHSAVAGTQAASFDGELAFGDGVIAMPSMGAAAVTIVGSLIADSDGVAIAAVDSSVSVAATAIGCAGAEPVVASAAALLSLQGDNNCGCGGIAALCESTIVDLLAPPVPSKLGVVSP